MGVIAQYDVGIGTIPTNAYLRISSIDYIPVDYYDPVFKETTQRYQWSYELSTYFNKECRDLEIIKEYMEKDFMLTSQFTNLSADIKTWINNNIVARAARPLQIMKHGTIEIDGYPDPSSDTATKYSFFYNKFKEQYTGVIMQNPNDEESTSQQIIDAFKKQHPEIFGGI